MDREEMFWIGRIRAGDTDYFQLLYDRHHQRVFALSYRFMRNTADAEEMVQEIFMRMLAKISSYNGKAAFSTWLYRLAVNTLINAEKKMKRRSVPDPVTADEQRAPGVDFAVAVALEQAVAELPEGYRRVFILHDQEGFDHAEISNILGCSVSNSKSQLCRARSALREKLSGVLGGVHV